MAAFCLVHGSAQGPAGWMRLVHALERRGHSAITPDLGEISPASESSVYAERIVQEIRNFVQEPIFIVGHSASGMFLPWTAHLIGSDRIAGLVYLAAYAPARDESFMSSFGSEEDMFNPGWIGKNPLDDDVAVSFLFHDCPPELLPWALSTRQLMVAQHALSEPLSEKATADVPNHYILCRDDRTLSPEWMFRAAKNRLGVEPIELPGGHCPFVSRPDTLADALVGL